MKITAIECLILDRSFPFVLVHTDEGLVGIGECFRRQPSVIKALIDDLLTPALIGKDPTDTAVRFDDMQRAASAYEMGGAVWCAIAGLDIALWDLKGKALGQPIANLLGGMKRDKIRMYASSMRRDLTPLEEGQRAASFVELGYSGYKLHSAVPGAIDDARDYTIATVTEVRAAVGDDIDILVDVNGAYSVHHAMEIGKALESLGVFHFEEPRPHYDLEGLATIADALDIPIAAGEMIYTHTSTATSSSGARWTSSSPTSLRRRASPSSRRLPNCAERSASPSPSTTRSQILSTVAHLHFCAAYADIVPYSQEYNIEQSPSETRFPS